MDDRHATILQRMRDKEKTGAYDEEYWIDFLEINVPNKPRSGLDDIASIFARTLATDCTTWDSFIRASENDILAYMILIKLSRRLIKMPTWLGFASTQNRTGDFAAASDKLIDWMLEVLEGNRPRPPRSPGRDKRYNMLRDAGIAAAIEGIAKLGRPATSPTHEDSACHVVARHIKKQPDTVRTIWKRRQRVRKRLLKGN